MGKIAFTLLLLISTISSAQIKLVGTISSKSTLETPVTVKVKDSLNESIIAYTFTDHNNKYKLTIDKIGNFNLVFTALGFEKKTIPITITKEQTELNTNVLLVEKSMRLDEVVIQAEKAIKVNNDTIVFKSKFFKVGTEETVEDLLKNIPGLQIDNEGTIKVGNQEIEKLMIDGDDFFKKGYKVLSKNMPAYTIEEIEILKNFSNNSLLKDIEESKKVALNLKVADKFKRVWFGNLEAGLGNDNFYEFRGNLMNFGKKNKFYFLTNLNNIGYDSTGDLQQLISPIGGGEVTSNGNNQGAKQLLNLSPSTANFNQNRTNINNAELASLNAIFNPTKKLKVKTLGFFNWDELDFFKNNVNVIETEGTSFTNLESYKLKNQKSIAFGKLELIYNSSKTTSLEATTKYNNARFNDGSNLQFNTTSTIQDLKHSKTLFDQKISYTQQLKNKKAIVLTGRFIDEKAPQNYSINRFFYQDLFPENRDASSVAQSSENQMQFAGINLNFLNRKKSNDLLVIQLGNEYRKDVLRSTFSLLKDNDVVAQPKAYQNDLTYLVNDLYFKGKYRLEYNDIGVTGKFATHQLFNKLENKQFSSTQNPFFINPSIGLDWKINDKNKVATAYSYNTTNAKILDVYSNFVLTGFRSFESGSSTFNQLDASRFNINYQLGNWTDKFFAHSHLVYIKNHNFLSSNTLINQNFTQTEKILIKDREYFSVNSSLDYYLNLISSNIKLDISYSKSDFKNVVNNSNLREVVSKNYNYGVALRSGYDGIFNYHIGTKWTTTAIRTTIANSFTDNMSFLNLSFVFNTKFNIQLQSERYYFGNLSTDNTYYFLDFNARYKLIKNKLSLGISGNNLFNTKTFRSYSVSDIGSSTTEYRLLPRFLLLKVNYRF